MADWKQIIVKVISICIMSFLGLIAGAVISYLVVGLIYIAIFGSGPVRNGYECARGMAIAYLSLIAGAILGFSIGAYGGYKFFRLGEDLEEYKHEPNL